jgi:hypothetical protein
MTSTTALRNWINSVSGPRTRLYMSSHCFRLVIKVWKYRNGLVARGLGETQLRLPGSLIGDVMESGALFSFAGSPTQVIIRVGVSFLSEQQACANAESEIGTATFDQIQAQSKTLWNERLSRIEIDVPHTPPNVTELLYSSLYRASLTPVSHFPILRAGPLTCSAAHQEQCHRRGTRRFSGHEFVLFRFIVLQVRLVYPDDVWICC